MSKSKEIICLATTLSIFRAYQIFPKKGEELNPGNGFYIKYTIGCSLASVVLFGSALHFVHTVIAKEYNHVYLDLSYVLSMTGGFLLFTLFSLNIKTATKMYTFLSDLQQFGKPPKFDKYNTFLNKAAKCHFIYLGIIISLFFVASNLFKGARCRRENEQHGYKETCGLVTNTWLPFNIDYFPAKQIYVALQFFSLYYVYMLAGSIPFMVMETVVHIGVRLDHVKEVFVDAINDEHPGNRRRKFNFAVRYHARILELVVDFCKCMAVVYTHLGFFRLENELNTCFKNAMLSHMVLTASIIGCAASGGMQSGSANHFCICVGWTLGMSCVCLSGQYLINKSLDVGVAIYDSKWYDMEPALQRDLGIVILRCHKAMNLRAAKFGVMNHSTLLAVLQASYSYITLLGGST